MVIRIAPERTGMSNSSCPFHNSPTNTDKQNSPSILVVDDDSSVLGLITTFLRREGYAVISCSSPLEALEASKHLNNSIEMLITDVDMPGMSGLDLAAEFCEMKPGVPILFISGLMELPDHQPTKELKTSVSFLQKPFTLVEFRQKVAYAFNQIRKSCSGNRNPKLIATLTD